MVTGIFLGLLCGAVYFYPVFKGARYWLMDRSCYYGDPVSVRLLLSVGASADGTGDYQDSVKHIFAAEFSSHLSQAVYSGELEIVKLLLQRGADPNVLEGEGWTALLVATEKNRPDMVKVLLEAGADPEQNGVGGDALSLARRKGHKEIEQILQSVPLGAGNGD